MRHKKLTVIAPVGQTDGTGCRALLGTRNQREVRSGPIDGGYRAGSDPALDGGLAGAAGEEAAAAEEALLDRREHQQFDQDADGQDQKDR